jgi:hypothetical protein
MAVIEYLSQGVAAAYSEYNTELNMFLKLLIMYNLHGCSTGSIGELKIAHLKYIFWPYD